MTNDDRRQRAAQAEETIIGLVATLRDEYLTELGGQQPATGNFLFDMARRELELEEAIEDLTDGTGPNARHLRAQRAAIMNAAWHIEDALTGDIDDSALARVRSALDLIRRTARRITPEGDDAT